MLYFSRFDISEGIDDNKTSASKESFSCHYWYFFLDASVLSFGINSIRLSIIVVLSSE